MSVSSMSWVTVIWSMAAGVSLTLAAVHLLVWLRDPAAVANLFFSVSALAAARFGGRLGTDHVLTLVFRERWSVPDRSLIVSLSPVVRPEPGERGLRDGQYGLEDTSAAHSQVLASVLRLIA